VWLIGVGSAVWPAAPRVHALSERCHVSDICVCCGAGGGVQEWKDDERSGKGSLTYGNKDMYIGTWVKGMREGDGKLCWATGAWYQGQFKKDLMHGAGILQNENQDRYDGEFFDGKRHGKGTWTPAGGAPRAGYWCMDEEVVGKSEDEALQMISEGVSKANKPVPASSHSDELAAKLSHRNARNEVRPAQLASHVRCLRMRAPRRCHTPRPRLDVARQQGRKSSRGARGAAA
jgi:hypothetical protein